MEKLSFGIYGGPLQGEMSRILDGGWGDAAKDYVPAPPEAAKGSDVWTILHTQERTVYSAYHNNYKLADGTPAHLIVCLFVPARMKMTDGKYPADVLKEIEERFNQGNRTLPATAPDAEPFQQIMRGITMEDRVADRQLPIMDGKKPGTIRLKSMDQLSALMRYSNYNELNRVSRLELSFDCDTNITIVRANIRKDEDQQPEPEPEPEPIPEPEPEPEPILEPEPEQKGKRKYQFSWKWCALLFVIFFVITFTLALMVSNCSGGQNADDLEDVDSVVVDTPEEEDTVAAVESNDADTVAVAEEHVEPAPQPVARAEEPKPVKREEPRQQPKQTDDIDLAIYMNDVGALKRLADAGERKAYIPLAKNYLKQSSTHYLAHKYAKKAQAFDPSGAQKIFDQLSALGYYD